MTIKKKPSHPAASPEANPPTRGEFLLYQTEDAQTRIQVRLIDGTLWLTQKQLAELYQVSVPTINGHLRNIYSDGELDAERTIRKSRIVALEAARNVGRLNSSAMRRELVLSAIFETASRKSTEAKRTIRNFRMVALEVLPELRGNLSH